VLFYFEQNGGIEVLVILVAVSALAFFGDCQSELCRHVAEGHLADMRWPDFTDYRLHVQNFYEPAGYALAWTSEGAPTRQTAALIDVLRQADSKGLDPEDYDGPRWTARLERLHNAPPLEGDLARFDLAVTVAAMRYASDLHIGRLNPGSLHPAFDMEHEKDDLASLLRKRLVAADDVRAVFSEIEPPFEGYQRTLEVLQSYIHGANEDDGEVLPSTPKPVEPGSLYPGTRRLSRLLQRLGDLTPDAVPATDQYTGALVDAVKHFQARHGLEPDGRIGAATWAELNTPLRRRVLQLQLTLERWRWVPHQFGRPPIVVNIPEFELRALNRSYRTELEMKVVVGRAYGHKTPVFAADMKYVIFRPYWNVPLSIQRAELVPKIEQDRSYLEKNGYEVVTSKDVVVTAGAIDDSTLAQLRVGKLLIRQIPGPKNSLGLVKFLFPNPHDVYLHDTPAIALFSKSRRDFSHGCIRVEEPRRLAAWVLGDRPEWPPERIAEAMNGNKTLQVNLAQPIPVLVVYATAVVLGNGEVHFFRDIYGQDTELEERLAEGRPYPKATSGAPGRHRRG
jgi:murein L,D-transpeptidase YcbB/YkuD